MSLENGAALALQSLTQASAAPTGTEAQMKEFYAAFVAMQAELPTVPKDATNPHFRSRYADLPTIMETIKPVLAKHGFAIMQPLLVSDNHQMVKMVTILMHQGGGIIDYVTSMPIEKLTPQGYGSAVTYLRRYALGSFLGIVTDEDDDGNASSGIKSEAPGISAAQVKRGYAIAKEHGYSEEDINAIIAKKGLSGFNKLTPDQYKSFISWLENNSKVAVNA